MTTGQDVRVVPGHAVAGRRGASALRILLGVVLGLLATFALATGLVIAADQQYEGRILPGVHVGSADLSGMDRAEARAALAGALAAYGQGTVDVTTRAGVERIPYSAIGRRADVDRLVAQAFAVGRDSHGVDRFVSDLRNAVRGVRIEPTVVVDPAAVRAAIAAIAARTDLAGANATVASSGTGFTVTPAEPGEAMDVQAASDQVVTEVSSTDAPSSVSVDATYTPTEAAVTTADAHETVRAAARMQGPVLVAQGADKWTVTAATVRTWISLGLRPDGSFGPVVDTARAAKSVAKLAPKIDRPAKSATFLLDKTGKIVGATGGRVGRTLDPAATAARVAEALLARGADPTVPNVPVELAYAAVDPTLTTAQAAAAAPLMKRISTWTTHYDVGPQNGFAANITIPTKIIDGTVVAPGDVFDFWKVVGIPTPEQGYTSGGAIINGHSAPTGAFAGGICSCSTTLFNAAVRAGFPILERGPHYYYIARYPLGLDATVWMTGGAAQTIAWRNDTAYPVLVRGFASPGVVRFDLYSVPTGRTTTFTDPIVKNRNPGTDVTQYTTSLPPGQTKRVEYPTIGQDTWVTRTVNDKDGKVIRTETFYSHYARVNGLILVGKEAAPAATPEPPVNVPPGDGGVIDPSPAP
jgi:vancomycin resistance protein YoaR